MRHWSDTFGLDQHAGKLAQKKCRCVGLADFWGVNTLFVAIFKLPTLAFFCKIPEFLPISWTAGTCDPSPPLGWWSGQEDERQADIKKNTQ